MVSEQCETLNYVVHKYLCIIDIYVSVLKVDTHYYLCITYLTCICACTCAYNTFELQWIVKNH